MQEVNPASDLEAHDGTCDDAAGLYDEEAESDRQGDCMRVVTDLLLSTLPKRERNILRLRYGLLPLGGPTGWGCGPGEAASGGGDGGMGGFDGGAPELGVMSLGVSAAGPYSQRVWVGKGSLAGGAVLRPSHEQRCIVPASHLTRLSQIFSPLHRTWRWPTACPRSASGR